MIQMLWNGSQELRFYLFFFRVILQKLGFQTTLTAFQHSSNLSNRICLIYLVSFYVGVTALVSKGRATDVVFLDLCKTFYTVLYGTLISEMDRDGFDGWMDKELTVWLQSTAQCPSGDKWHSSGQWRYLTSLLTTWTWIECILSKFANNTKLCGADDTLEGKDAVLRDIDRLEKQAHGNFIKFDNAKWEFCTWVTTTPNTNAGWVVNGLTAALTRMNWACWFRKSSTKSSNASSQPTKTAVSWAASKVVWQADEGRWSFTLPSWELTWSAASSSAASKTRKTRTHWNKSTGGPQWSENFSILLWRQWRWFSLDKSRLQWNPMAPSGTLRGLQESWRGTFSSMCSSRTRGFKLVRGLERAP